MLLLSRYIQQVVRIVRQYSDVCSDAAFVVFDFAQAAQRHCMAIAAHDLLRIFTHCSGYCAVYQNVFPADVLYGAAVLPAFQDV